MATTTDRFKLTCSGRIELPDDDPVHGTYWMPYAFEIGTATDINDAIALAERRASDPEFRYLGFPRDRMEPSLIFVHDTLNRLVLGGRVVPTGMTWSMPVSSAEEEANVRQEVRGLKDLGSIEHGWDNYSTAQGLWDRAAVLETRLVDPCWRPDALAALHQHNHKAADNRTD